MGTRGDAGLLIPSARRGRALLRGERRPFFFRDGVIEQEGRFEAYGGLRSIADIAMRRYAAGVETEALATFEGPTGSLRIGVERYQFPEITDDDWDSNWLIVTGDAVLDDNSWSFRDPCLTTFEMERLANWLDEVSDGRVEKAFCGFTEPNLDFERMSDTKVRGS